MNRSSGILLHISSLPSPYGIGSLGREAYAFVDQLERAHQSYWQVLPLGPTGYGDSPYQTFSAFAGNPYFIDLDTLVGEGLLDRSALEAIDWGSPARQVDYGKIYFNRFSVLKSAFARAAQNGEQMRTLDEFARQNADWLDDYALFMSLKDENGGVAWSEWPYETRMREQSALDFARERLQESIRFYQFIQWLFFEQWAKLKAYANGHSIKIVGDLPIYVPLDSADVWSAPEEFQLDEERRPRCVAGVPPDYFSEDGQLWGNPIYDWDYMKQTGYAWWIRRMRSAATLFDCLRIDHFRGLSSYWSVTAGAETARKGVWVQGPGIDFVNTIKAACPQMEVIAEDLGYLTDEVRSLLSESGFPGMKVLQFAFDSREPSNYLPHTYGRHCVCYAGTHDNTTTAGWFSEADSLAVSYAAEYLGLNEREGYVWGILRGGMGSVSDLFVSQMQDYLGLDALGRMNIPGTLGGNNWRWRLLPGEFTDALIERIAAMTTLYGR
ncbi:MAG TPA: 4-alpha-glucanotransferase [Candidatus Cryosericum sp.]|nr:4-alpha-glucanotransferase [Candidatus Cryosericum sp.]